MNGHRGRFDALQTSALRLHRNARTCQLPRAGLPSQLRAESSPLAHAGRGQWTSLRFEAAGRIDAQTTAKGELRTRLTSPSPALQKQRSPTGKTSPIADAS